jgi:hypothetical protein
LGSVATLEGGFAPPPGGSFIVGIGDAPFELLQAINEAKLQQAITSTAKNIFRRLFDWRGESRINS